MTRPLSIYCTLLTKVSYLPGLLVLHDSLKASDSKYPLVALVTSTVTLQVRNILARRGIVIKDVQSLLPVSAQHALDDRLRDAWTKLRVFELVEYERVVLIDSDALVLRNMDELMDVELPGDDWIAAAHACTCNPRKFPHYPKDWIPENCPHTPLTYPSCLSKASAITPESPGPYRLLNSGVVVLNPSMETMAIITDFLNTSPLVTSFKFADQDTLAECFQGKWQPLPYIYNALKTLCEAHPSIWRDGDIKCIHYILDDKPWMERPPSQGKTTIQELNTWWWSQYDSLIEKIKDDLPSGDWELINSQLCRGLGANPLSPTK